MPINKKYLKATYISDCYLIHICVHLFSEAYFHQPPAIIQDYLYVLSPDPCNMTGLPLRAFTKPPATWQDYLCVLSPDPCNMTGLPLRAFTNPPAIWQDYLCVLSPTPCNMTGLPLRTFTHPLQHDRTTSVYFHVTPCNITGLPLRTFTRPPATWQGYLCVLSMTCYNDGAPCSTLEGAFSFENPLYFLFYSYRAVIYRMLSLYYYLQTNINIFLLFINL